MNFTIHGSIFSLECFKVWCYNLFCSTYFWATFFLLWMKLLFKLSKHNQMRANPYMRHLILLILCPRDSNSLIKNNLCENLFCVKFDHQITYDQHVKRLCKKSKCKTKSASCGCLTYGISKKIKNEFFFWCNIHLFSANMDNP